MLRCVVLVRVKVQDRFADLGEGAAQGISQYLRRVRAWGGLRRSYALGKTGTEYYHIVRARLELLRHDELAVLAIIQYTQLHHLRTVSALHR